MQFQESLRAQFWVLSYLLFLIYVDDVINGPFSPGTRIILYSDDILLYRTISSSSDYSYQSCNQITGPSKLQPRFSTLSNASLHWSLANWTGKTTCLLVYNNQWPNAGNCLYIQISRLVSHIWLVLVKTYRRSMHQEKKSWAYCIVDFTTMLMWNSSTIHFHCITPQRVCSCSTALRKVFSKDLQVYQCIRTHKLVAGVHVGCKKKKKKAQLSISAIDDYK